MGKLISPFFAPQVPKCPFLVPHTLLPRPEVLQIEERISSPYIIYIYFFPLAQPNSTLSAQNNPLLALTHTGNRVASRSAHRSNKTNCLKV
eukprot:jgi/Botrbrau1/11044/Bobra.92_2s0015.1